MAPMDQDRDRARLLALGGGVAVAVGDLVWYLTKHRVPYGCSDIDRYSPVAGALVIAGAILAVATWAVTIVDRIAYPPRGRYRWPLMSRVVASLVILGAAVSGLVLYLDATLQFCF